MLLIWKVNAWALFCFRGLSSLHFRIHSGNYHCHGLLNWCGSWFHLYAAQLSSGSLPSRCRPGPRPNPCLPRRLARRHQASQPTRTPRRSGRRDGQLFLYWVIINIFWQETWTKGRTCTWRSSRSSPTGACSGGALSASTSSRQGSFNCTRTSTTDWATAFEGMKLYIYQHLIVIEPFATCSWPRAHLPARTSDLSFPSNPATPPNFISFQRFSMYFTVFQRLSKNDLLTFFNTFQNKPTFQQMFVISYLYVIVFQLCHTFHVSYIFQQISSVSKYIIFWNSYHFSCISTNIMSFKICLLCKQCQHCCICWSISSFSIYLALFQYLYILQHISTFSTYVVSFIFLFFDSRSWISMYFMYFDVF